MPRACIFCQQSTSLTREHVYPDWLSEQFGRGSKGFAMLSGTAQRTWPQQVFQQKAKVVCGTCNGGWMSELENSVKDTLGPMILEHKPTKLDKDLQTAIAFWAIKTMLVIQHVFPTDSRLIPTADYLALYERKAPLPNYVVFLGFRENFPRDNGSLVATHQIEQLRSIESHISAADNIKQQISAGKKVYGGSLVIGYVAFHIIGHNLGDTNINVPPLETFELPISPYSHDFNWPATFPIELMGGLDAYRAVFNPPE